jgi:hypothetical protein
VFLNSSHRQRQDRYRQDLLRNLMRLVAGVNRQESCSAKRSPTRPHSRSKARELGPEGIVSERAGSFYRCGRSCN